MSEASITGEVSRTDIVVVYYLMYLEVGTIWGVVVIFLLIGS